MDDRRRMEDVERLARLLDDVVTIPGTRIRLGVDALLGLVPGGGDVLSGALSGWILIVAARLGAPPAVIARMGGNVLLDTIAGAVPVLGDLFDIAFRANRRNVELLRSYMATPGPVHRSSRAVVVVVLLILLAALIGAALVAILIVRWVIGLF